MVVNNNAAADDFWPSGRLANGSRGGRFEGSARRDRRKFSSAPRSPRFPGARRSRVGHDFNKTRLADYACGDRPPETAMPLLRVHPSNYRVVGLYRGGRGIADLARLGRGRPRPLDDRRHWLGSSRAPGLPPHASGASRPRPGGTAAGADLVPSFGRQAPGRPQSRVILIGSARSDRAQVRRDPLMRGVRVDKMTLAAPEATLHSGARLRPWPGRRIPLWSFLSVTRSKGRARSGPGAWRGRRFAPSSGSTRRSSRSTAFLGGGSCLLEPLPTAVVRVGPPASGAGSGIGRRPGRCGWTLRLGDPAVVTRGLHGEVPVPLFDLPRRVASKARRRPSIVRGGLA